MILEFAAQLPSPSHHDPSSIFKYAYATSPLLFATVCYCFFFVLAASMLLLLGSCHWFGDLAGFDKEANRVETKEDILALEAA